MANLTTVWGLLNSAERQFLLLCINDARPSKYNVSKDEVVRVDPVGLEMLPFIDVREALRSIDRPSWAWHDDINELRKKLSNYS